MNRKVKVRKDQFLDVIDYLFNIGYVWNGGETRTGIDSCDAIIHTDERMKIRYWSISQKEQYDMMCLIESISYIECNAEELILLNKKSVNKNKKAKMALKDVLAKKFVFIDDVAEILEIGKGTNKNVFLYGRGGHAKSEIISEVLKFIDPKGEESFVQACGEGLSEEKLFGGMNLAKFQKTGEIEYLVENSFMNKKYVVFEELLDSRINVLLSLKDILTSGMFRQGHQQFKIKTEFVICLTNRTKQEVSEDNSVKALLERFPLEQKVEWDRYESQDYQLMFSKVLGNSFYEVGDLCQCINETGDFVSPRTAIHMAQVYKHTQDISSLKFFGASAEIIERMAKLKKDQDDRDLIIVYSDRIDNISNSVDCNSLDSLKIALNGAKAFQSEISQKSFSDKVYSEFVEVKKKTDSTVSFLKEKILQLIENG